MKISDLIKWLEETKEKIVFASQAQAQDAGFSQGLIGACIRGYSFLYKADYSKCKLGESK